ncbi:MAG: hypothetical protein ACOZCP_21285 [Pseudomonadota bacterium]
MKTLLVSICAAALAFTAPAAHSQDKAPPTGNAKAAVSEASAESNLFQQLDTNKDYAIDEGEAQASPRVKGNFKAMDSNRDGKISYAEWVAYSSKLE